MADHPPTFLFNDEQTALIPLPAVVCWFEWVISPGSNPARRRSVVVIGDATVYIRTCGREFDLRFGREITVAAHYWG